MNRSNRQNRKIGFPQHLTKTLTYHALPPRIHDELHLMEGGHLLVSQHLGRLVHAALTNLGDLALWELNCQCCSTWRLKWWPQLSPIYSFTCWHKGEISGEAGCHLSARHWIRRFSAPVRPLYVLLRLLYSLKVDLATVSVWSGLFSQFLPIYKPRSGTKLNRNQL